MNLLQAPRRSIPTFSLYGELPDGGAQADFLHIEDIPSRSRKYLWKIAPHRHHNLCQCVFLSAGEVTVDLDGARSVLKGAAVVIVPPGTVHGFRFRTDTQGVVLTVDLERLLTLASAHHQAPIQALFGAARTIELAADPELAVRAAHLFARLLDEFRQPETPGSPIGSWLACAALWLLATKCDPHPSGDARCAEDMRRLRQFRALIEAHFLKHWPVIRHARRLALSESSLNRLCRRLTGATAFELLQQRLALEARRRLMFIAGPVAGLAAELGFKDPAYFGRFFRRHHGVSPAAYRRLHGGREVR
jgi:AraC family transcriptional activator of pobA